MVDIQDAVEHCERALREYKADCQERQIYPGWSSVIDRFLDRQDELRDAYKCIYQFSKNDRRVALTFFDALLCTIAVWHPDDVRQMRESKKKLAVLNDRIVEQAYLLADLLEERDEILNSTPFRMDVHYSIMRMIRGASERNHLFQSWVVEDFDALSCRFDGKYWPDIPSVIRELGHNSAQAEIGAFDTVAKAALHGARSSKADFTRALMTRIDEERQQYGVHLPTKFHLKDESWASFINVALDLPDDEIVDGLYVKGLRQRMRKADANF